MKRFSITLFFYCYLFFLFSISLWETPTTIFESSFIKGMDATISMPQGVVTVWSDARNDSRSLHAQCLTSNGIKLWEENGIFITTSIYHQLSHKIIKADDSSFIVTWIEKRQNSYKYYAQKISMNGLRLWGNEGVFINNEQSFNNFNKIISDNTGGFFTYKFQNGVTYIDHIDANGQILPQVSFSLTNIEYVNQIKTILYKNGQGFYICYYQNQCLNICLMNENGTIVWDQEFQNSYSGHHEAKFIETNDGKVVLIVTNENLFAQKYNSDGSQIWGDVPIEIYSNSVNQYTDIIAKIDNNNCMLITFLNSLYQQTLIKVDENCINVWQNPIILYSNTNNNPPPELVINNNYYYIYWTNYYTGVYHNTLFLKKGQKVTTSGEFLWEEDGRTFFYDSPIKPPVVIHNDTYQFFVNNYNNSESVNAYIMNSDDIIISPNDPFIIFQGNSSYVYDFKLLHHNNNNYIVWRNISNNYSSLSNIYYQIIDSNGLPQFETQGRLIATINANNLIYETKIDQQGNLIVLWSVEKSSYEYYKQEIRIQKITTNGDYVYPEEGLLIYKSPIFKNCQNIDMFISNDDLFFYITFTNYDNMCYYIVGQKVSSNEVMWDLGGKEIVNKSNISLVDDENISCNLLSIGEYNHLIVWQEQNDFINPIIKYIFLDNDGNAIETMNPEGETLFNFYQDSALYYSYLFEFDDQLLCFGYEMGELSFLDYSVMNLDGTIITPQNRLIEDSDYRNINIDWNDKIIIQSYSYLDLMGQNVAKKYNYLFDNHILSSLWESPQVLESLDRVYYLFSLSDMSINIYYFQESNGTYIVSSELFDENGENNGQEYTLFTEVNNDLKKLKYNKIDNTHVLVGLLNSFSNPNESIISRSLKLQMINTDTNTDADDMVNNGSNYLTIHQNYPNPFNPKTKIKYSLKVNSGVDICIYNIKGQKVKTLLSEYQFAGNHEVIWDGQDSNKNAVPSGVYFYKIQTEKQTETRKMLLLK